MLPMPLLLLATLCTVTASADRIRRSREFECSESNWIESKRIELSWMALSDFTTTVKSAAPSDRDRRVCLTIFECHRHFIDPPYFDPASRPLPLTSKSPECQRAAVSVTTLYSDWNSSRTVCPFRVSRQAGARDDGGNRSADSDFVQSSRILRYAILGLAAPSK